MCDDAQDGLRRRCRPQTVTLVPCRLAWHPWCPACGRQTPTLLLRGTAINLAPPTQPRATTNTLSAGTRTSATQPCVAVISSTMATRARVRWEPAITHIALAPAWVIRAGKKLEDASSQDHVPQIHSLQRALRVDANNKVPGWAMR